MQENFLFRKDSNFFREPIIIPIYILVHVIAYLFILELSVYCEVEQVHLWQFIRIFAIHEKNPAERRGEQGLE